jgi:hypothetical protein
MGKLYNVEIINILTDHEESLRNLKEKMLPNVQFFMSSTRRGATHSERFLKAIFDDVCSSYLLVQEIHRQVLVMRDVLKENN